MEYKKYDMDQYNIYTIKTNKFKTCYMELIYRNKASMADITKRYFLSKILTTCSKNNPRPKDIGVALDELYCANIRSVITRTGNTVFTNYCMSFLNPKYTSKNLTVDAIKLFFECLNNPCIESNSFTGSTFDIIKNKIRADLLAEKEYPLSYAIKRMLKIMGPKKPLSLAIDGTLSELESITRESLAKFYKETLNSPCDIYLIGDLDMDEVVKTIDANFKNKPKSKAKASLHVSNNGVLKLTTKKESEPFEQSYLIAGYDIIKPTKRELNYVLFVYNIILGAGSLDTKLYKYLREENSLCYNTRSYPQKYDKALIITASLGSSSSYDLATSLINKAIKEMTIGKFSEKDLANAKKLLESSLNLSEDNQASLINRYVFKNIDNIPDNETRIKIFNTISKEEIISFAKKVKPNTIYYLEGSSD